MRWALPLLAGGLAMPICSGAAAASVLCRTRTNTLIVRDACKRREDVVTPAQQVGIGMQGPAGPSGPSGPRVRDLEVSDSTGREVGVVMSLGGYYGTATVVGKLTVPGAAGPEFYVFTVDPRGLDTRGSSCQDSELQYFRSSDCTGDTFASCDYGACSSASGAFLARPLYRQDTSTACYVGDASEFQRGNFYQRFDVHGLTSAETAARCTFKGGILVAPVAPCDRGPKTIYCATCCRLARNVGVSPVHTIDAGVVGTPPFRLSR